MGTPSSADMECVPRGGHSILLVAARAYGHREAAKDLAAVKSYSLAVDMVDCQNDGSHINHTRRLAAYVEILETLAAGSSHAVDGDTDGDSDSRSDQLPDEAAAGSDIYRYGHDEAVADLAAMKSITLVIDMANDSEDESRLLPVNRLAEYVETLEASAGSGHAVSD